jgi:DNA-binding TFAR19-related protein (PDSD5 family)
MNVINKDVVKMNEKEEDHEIEKIRMKKMKELIEAQRRQEQSNQKVVSLQEKVQYILSAVLDPTAYAHLNEIKAKEPNIYQAIFNELVSPDVIQNIDYLIQIIQRRGGVARRIPLDVIIYLERKVKGIKGSIKIKQGDGKLMDLGSYLTRK